MDRSYTCALCEMVGPDKPPRSAVPPPCVQEPTIRGHRPIRIAWAVLSCIIVYGGFYYPVRSLSALDNSLDMLDCLGCEKLFASLFAGTGGHVFNNEEIASLFQRIGHFRVYHCLFHS